MERHDAIEAQLEHERRELALRLDSLSVRLNAASVAAEASRSAAGLAKQVAAGLWKRSHPPAAAPSAATIRRPYRPATCLAKEGMRGVQLETAEESNFRGDHAMSDMSANTDALAEAGENAVAQATSSLDALRARIDEGLDGLSGSARSRVVTARNAAIEAQEQVEARARSATETVKTTARENPLLVGVLAFAAGATVAALLPRTSAENRALGAHRDRLLDEAERIYREERESLAAAAMGAMDECKDQLVRATASDDGASKGRDSATA